MLIMSFIANKISELIELRKDAPPLSTVTNPAPNILTNIGTISFVFEANAFEATKKISTPSIRRTWWGIIDCAFIKIYTQI